VGDAVVVDEAIAIISGAVTVSEYSRQDANWDEE
jgi:hypothetical protein